MLEADFVVLYFLNLNLAQTVAGGNFLIFRLVHIKERVAEIPVGSTFVFNENVLYVLVYLAVAGRKVI